MEVKYLLSELEISSIKNSLHFIFQEITPRYRELDKAKDYGDEWQKLNTIRKNLLDIQEIVE